MPFYTKFIYQTLQLWQGLRPQGPITANTYNIIISSFFVVAQNPNVGTKNVEIYLPNDCGSQILPKLHLDGYKGALDIVVDKVILFGVDDQILYSNTGFLTPPTCLQMNMSTYI